MRDISIRVAATGEWELVAGLLEQTGLDASDVDLLGTTFHIAVAGNAIAGCAGTERHGDTAVVGPVAVLPEHRDRGIASHLVQAALMRARAGGCRRAVFLSSLCASYFSRHGFLLTPRSALPTEVRASKSYHRQESLAPLCMTCDLT
ncbi:GNAT family N-acetyltransferase [Cupriavidus pinatubonensis]|uniref:GNAT family N-acetyltransferase n=1 Tax=Cupriavidus pinatubonensis TaxID=248026 RepID=UPI0029620FD9|nr:GNAT family N-acetyltransferase [Cupriavidus pinatubonensis]